MNNEQIKSLTLALVNADSEREVVKVLQKHQLWDDKSAWKEVNESSGNWSTIGSQQSSADAALVEKIVNSVDAVLMRECKRRGIAPESSAAPKSIPEAQKEYFSIYNGKLSSIDISARIKLAENIYLVATGQKTNPSYSVIDLGEGQSPETFPDTFLSLNRSNKDRVQFVQGKFGMGGTGIFRFASPEHRLQLILSRKDPAIKVEAGSEEWGITVMRRMPPTAQMRSSVFTYLAPTGKVLSFKADTLPLLPGKFPLAYSEPMKWGSFIKIYEYDLAGFKSNVRLDLFYRLALLLPNIALPITLAERRNYDDSEGKTRNMTIVMAGLSVRLDADRQNNLEDNFPSTGELNVKGQKMDYSIYAFKKGRRQTYSGNEGVLFSVNGQAHGFLPKSFFERKAVGMSYLSDSILVLVDCSKLEKKMHEDLFMNSRDRLSEGPLKAEIERQLEDIIKNHQGLRELRERRRREDIEDKLQDSKPLAEVLENIINKSPSLSSLFNKGLTIQNPFNLVDTGVKKEYRGRRFPSYFELIKKYPADRPKHVLLNVRRFRVQFETDAENEYFNRDREPGALTLELNGSPIQDYSLNLWNGIATLSVQLPRSTKVGDSLSFETNVTDVSRSDPFSNTFNVEVILPQNENNGHRGTRKYPPSDTEGEERQKPTGLALPNTIEVRTPEWEKYSFGTFNDRSALKVVDAGEGAGYDFYINMDNVFLLMEVKQNKKIDPKLLEARFKYGMVLLGLSLIDFEEKHKNKDENDVSISDKISDITSAIAPTLLPMVASLGDLTLDDGSE